MIKVLYVGSSKYMISYFGKNTDFELTARDTLHSALNFLDSGGSPEVIFCDARIPEGTWQEMHRLVREQLQLKSTVFILVSEEYSENLYKSSFQNKVDDYYVLPLPGYDDLYERLRFLIKYRLETANGQLPEVATRRSMMSVSKRMFDLVVATSALIILSPLLIIVMIAIRLESKGKIYYTSKRIGQKPFDFYKFRSMRTGTDSELDKLAKKNNKYSAGQEISKIDFEGPCRICPPVRKKNCSDVLHLDNHEICEPWYQYQKTKIARSNASFIKITDDPRITRVGKIIRNLSIDELPQLINVIKGDMSLVGNRPLPVYEAEKLTDDRMARRFLAPAGLTGLWQVELRGRAGKMSEEERKRLDNKYATMYLRNRYSFWYDMKLILRTIPAIFQKDSV